MILERKGTETIVKRNNETPNQILSGEANKKSSVTGRQARFTLKLYYQEFMGIAI
jgi:hypothetical protein